MVRGFHPASATLGLMNFAKVPNYALRATMGRQNFRKVNNILLKSGGNDYPIEQLKGAGVDLSSPQPIEDAKALFNDLVV